MKRLIKSFLNDTVRVQKLLNANSQFAGTDYEWVANFGEGYRVGIIYDHFRQHDYYLQACHDLKIGYQVIDIRKDNWITEIEDSKLEDFIVWPSIYLLEHRYFWDSRLKVLTEMLGKNVFPGSLGMWLYESKIRTKDWLTLYNYPAPKTSVFFDSNEARRFLKENTNYPIVVKTDQAASASGVFIAKSPKEARKFVKLAFSWGIGLKKQPLYRRHKGSIIFQEYIPDAKEWRIIKVGESFFCRKKVKVGEFHSGSGSIKWAKPPLELLNRTREVSLKHNLVNINIDYFENKNGEYLINEVHALWGGKDLPESDLEGRYLYNEEKGSWSFEKGDFFKNRCANLRLSYFLRI